MMKIIDVTKPIENGKCYYPSLTAPEINLLRHFSLGHNRWTSSICMPLHTATHIDAPAHFFSDGKTVDSIPLNHLITFAQVIDCSNKEVITKRDLTGRDFLATLLFKTKSDLESYTHFDMEAANFIVKKGVRNVGTEAQSVDRFGDPEYPVHKTLLGNNIIIVEGLNLEQVKEGVYLFVCLPLLIKNVEAAPARALLIEI